MIAPLHQQLRAAREAHGYSQHKLASLAGLVRTDIQRIERGDNVTIRKIEAYIGALPHLQALHFGGVQIKGKITVDVETVRQMVLDMVTTGANVLQVLGQLDERQAPPGATQESAGATRYQRKPGVSPALKDHLREVDPTYKASQAARKTAPPPDAPAGLDAPLPPKDES
ncbi:MAG TPA: helix-turn-helix transcriptional regulator [Thermoanaerobaculia bacterium]|nr:helix-turn-helix transcriptional regulator [Thermoanaerobaculia bacterium]